MFLERSGTWVCTVLLWTRKICWPSVPVLYTGWMIKPYSHSTTPIAKCMFWIPIIKCFFGYTYWQKKQKNKNKKTKEDKNNNNNSHIFKSVSLSSNFHRPIGKHAYIGFLAWLEHFEQKRPTFFDIKNLYTHTKWTQSIFPYFTLTLGFPKLLKKLHSIGHSFDVMWCVWKEDSIPNHIPVVNSVTKSGLIRREQI